MLKLLSLITLLAGFTFVARAETLSQKSREYRPLEAKKVSIHTGARAIPSIEDANSFLDFKRIGWLHFDNREWRKATDAFLSALEKNPESVEVAEALAMSLYRSGDYGSAYRLAQELLRIMPTVASHLSRTVDADVRYMVQRGEFAVVREFLAHFPASDPAYAAAHRFVSDAAVITAAVGPTGDQSIEPTDEARESFVKN